MKSSESFLSLGNHLTLHYTHCNYGSFPETVHYHDINPANRLYAIHRSSGSGGSFIGRLNGAEPPRELKSGMVYFIPGGFDLEFRFEPDLEFTAIHFYLEPFAGFDLFHGEKEIRVQADGAGLAGELIGWLDRDESTASVMAVQGLFSRLISLFLTGESERTRRAARLEERYGRLFDWIAAHPRAGLSTADALSGAGLAGENLPRRFAADMGLTLKSFMNRTLVREIAGRLVYSTDNLKSIAHDMGFKDEYYFSRFFKRGTGLPPGEYRRRYGLP